MPQRLWAIYQPGVSSAAPGIVSGVPVLGSFVNFAAAALDLFVLPVRNYQSDGGYAFRRPPRWGRGTHAHVVPAPGFFAGDARAHRVVDGLRRGVNTLVWTTAVETINISFKIMMGTHVRALNHACGLDAG